MRFKPKTYSTIKVLVNQKFLAMDYLYKRDWQSQEQFKQMQFQMATNIIQSKCVMGYILDSDNSTIYLVLDKCTKPKAIPIDQYDVILAQFMEAEKLDELIPPVSLAVNNEAVFLSYNTVPKNISKFAQRVRQLEFCREYLKQALLESSDNAVFVYDGDIYLADCYNKKGSKLDYEVSLQ